MCSDRFGPGLPAYSQALSRNGPTSPKLVQNLLLIKRLCDVYDDVVYMNSVVSHSLQSTPGAAAAAGAHYLTVSDRSVCSENNLT